MPASTPPLRSGARGVGAAGETQFWRPSAEVNTAIFRGQRGLLGPSRLPALSIPQPAKPINPRKLRSGPVQTSLSEVLGRLTCTAPQHCRARPLPINANGLWLIVQIDMQDGLDACIGGRVHECSMDAACLP